MTEPRRIQVPTNPAGEPYPYDVTIGENGEPDVGPSIVETVAEDKARRRANDGSPATSGPAQPGASRGAPAP